MRRKVVGGAVAALTMGAVMSASTPASAITITGTVPNIYACSHWTGRCTQTNGAHVSWLPNACYWTWGWVWTSTGTGVCSYWM